MPRSRAGVTGCSGCASRSARHHLRSSYTENRVGEVINFNYDTNVSNKSRPARGVDSSLISEAQNSVINPSYVNAYINPSTVNPSVNYLSPSVTLTAGDSTEWLI